MMAVSTPMIAATTVTKERATSSPAQPLRTNTNSKLFEKVAVKLQKAAAEDQSMYTTDQRRRTVQGYNDVNVLFGEDERQKESRAHKMQKHFNTIANAAKFVGASKTDTTTVNKSESNTTTTTSNSNTQQVSMTRPSSASTSHKSAGLFRGKVDAVLNTVPKEFVLSPAPTLADSEIYNAVLAEGAAALKASMSNPSPVEAASSSDVSSKPVESTSDADNKPSQSTEEICISCDFDKLKASSSESTTTTAAPVEVAAPVAEPVEVAAPVAEPVQVSAPVAAPVKVVVPVEVAAPVAAPVEVSPRPAAGNIKSMISAWENKQQAVDTKTQRNFRPVKKTTAPAVKARVASMKGEAESVNAKENTTPQQKSTQQQNSNNLEGKAIRQKMRALEKASTKSNNGKNSVLGRVGNIENNGQNLGKARMPSIEEESNCETRTATGRGVRSIAGRFQGKDNMTQGKNKPTEFFQSCMAGRPLQVFSGTI